MDVPKLNPARSPLKPYLGAGRCSVHQGEETIRRLYACNYEISKEWTCFMFKVPKAQLSLLFITDNEYSHKSAHMPTAGDK